MMASDEMMRWWRLFSPVCVSCDPVIKPVIIHHVALPLTLRNDSPHISVSCCYRVVRAKNGICI